MSLVTSREFRPQILTFGLWQRRPDPSNVAKKIGLQQFGSAPLAASGFDPAKVDAEFFVGTQVHTNFLINIGYGDTTKLFPRDPRLAFEEIAHFA
jgi:hypothetical protein